MAAEATSAKFKNLQLQDKLIDSESILDLMRSLEQEHIIKGRPIQTVTKLC
jgi:hypothetical protein